MRVLVAFVFLVGCKDKKQPPPPPPPPPDIDAAVAAPIDAHVDAAPPDALDPEMAKMLAKPAGSPDRQIATWWNEAARGDARTHAAREFVVEALVPPDVFAGQTICGNPYVTDVPRTDDVCLHLAFESTRPPATWRDGWGCKHFSGTNLAKSIQSSREAAKHRLRCGPGVFFALDEAGNVSAFLVNSRDSR